MIVDFSEAVSCHVGRGTVATFSFGNVVVCDSFIDSEKNIFNALGIKDKMMFCERIYGYKPEEGRCPEFMMGDFNAAKRLLVALYFVDMFGFLPSFCDDIVKVCKYYRGE
jgi:hypothetical protein